MVVTENERNKCTAICQRHESNKMDHTTIVNRKLQFQKLINIFDLKKIVDNNVADDKSFTNIFLNSEKERDNYLEVELVCIC